MTQNVFDSIEDLVHGLSANIQVLVNVIDDPKGGSEFAKLIILETAKNTVRWADEWLKENDWKPFDDTTPKILNKQILVCGYWNERSASGEGTRWKGSIHWSTLDSGSNPKYFWMYDHALSVYDPKTSPITITHWKEFPDLPLKDE